MTACGKANKNNKFMMNAFEDTLLWKNNGLKAVSVLGDEPVVGKALRLLTRSSTLKMQQWNPTTVPNTFQIMSKVQTSAGNHLCIAAESLSEGAQLKSSDCDPAQEMQQW